MLHRERKPRFLPFRIPNPESRIPAPPMHAYVYKSLRKADTYVYLAEREDFERLPEPLRAQLEPLRFVLDVALVPGRKLAREDVEAASENLVKRGLDRKSTRLNSSTNSESHEHSS